MLRLPIDILQPGMVLARPVLDERGNVLLRHDIPLTSEYIASLKRRGFSSVYISDGDTNDVVIEDVLSDEVRRNARATLAQVFDLARQVSSGLAHASSDEVVAGIQDAGVAGALRGDDSFKQLEQVVTSIVDELMGADMLTGIAQIRSHDDVTFGHSLDVAVTAIMIGKQLCLNRQDLKQLGAGCILHDIGKIFVDPRILTKGQPLTPAEQARLKEHPRLGYELLRARNPDSVMTNHVALEHHERQDGKGYPRRLYGTNGVERLRFDRQNILLIAEIAAIADTYDMLSAERPEWPALAPQQIADTMRRLSGAFLNRQIVQHFLTLLPLLPVGIDVVVRTGQYARYKGIVAQANAKQPDRPLIRLLYNPQGDRIVPIDLDLAHAHAVSVEAMLCH
jgi:HD-GYP domain-containing protein (c-di-GMP phosphodiesterase class II)